ncbi:hypothetical protein DL764_007305 [Monosporascus ibericus]|uniref:protein-ribulosamine 3-kinase n=1 Tax=Monosporascus ibericus TaxID=155417 RepID=A0A4Q4T1Y5_9PEZI|nr:hypothetical protein DL764_007305 [Monosporascus ibericus]
MNIDTLDPAILAGQFDTLQDTASGWSTGLKVDVEVNGEEKEYFLKVVQQERFVEMSRAEYEGQKALATYIPDNERGKDSELEEVAEHFIQKVIPRLLRPLQTGGRIIKPTLCHGDLWDGNIQIDVETKQPILFDSCCFYGHNEMDLQCMGDPRYALSMEFIDMYKNEVGASEPQEDFYDRHDLYAIRNNICTAGMWPQWAPLLQTAKQAMRRLLAKHPQGLDGFQAE